MAGGPNEPPTTIPAARPTGQARDLLAILDSEVDFLRELLALWQKRRAVLDRELVALEHLDAASGSPLDELRFQPEWTRADRRHLHEAITATQAALRTAVLAADELRATTPSGPTQDAQPCEETATPRPRRPTDAMSRAEQIQNTYDRILERLDADPTLTWASVDLRRQLDLGADDAHYALTRALAQRRVERVARGCYRSLSAGPAGNGDADTAAHVQA